jgi:hypothetical protein
MLIPGLKAAQEKVIWSLAWEVLEFGPQEEWMVSGNVVRMIFDEILCRPWEDTRLTIRNNRGGTAFVRTQVAPTPTDRYAHSLQSSGGLSAREEPRVIVMAPGMSD